MLEAEREVISQAVARPVPLVEDSPHPFPPAAAPDMLFSHAARATDGCGDREPMRDGRRTREAAVQGDGLLLKRGGRGVCSFIVELSTLLSKTISCEFIQSRKTTKNRI